MTSSQRTASQSMTNSPSSIPQSEQNNDVILNHDRQLRCFDAYMRVYKNKAYESGKHMEWVKIMLRIHPELCRTTLIYHNEDESWGRHNASNDTWLYGLDDKIRRNLMFPIPVYWGAPKDTLFDWSAVTHGFGYKKEQASRLPTEIRDTIRYAIVGAVKVMPHCDLPERDAYVIHTEGVNLESSETPAFKAIVSRRATTKEKLAVYFKRHRSMLKLIIEAAMSQVAPGEHAHIQAPMIGAGCFLRGLDGTGLDPSDFLEQQILALQSVLNEAPIEYNFIYKLCIFNTEEFSNDIIAAYRQMASSNARMVLGTNEDGGNVLSGVPLGNPNQKVFVVNAGDLRSCIGNGMSHENSVEGFIVANAQGFNPQWQNTCFLHNPYFNPDIFNPIKSAAKGRQVWQATMMW